MLDLSSQKSRVLSDILSSSVTKMFPRWKGAWKQRSAALTLSL
jgi:hypothetical protein